MSWRRRLFDLHGVAGLAAGLLLVLVGFTGSAAVFRAELDWLASPALRVAAPARALDPEALVHAVRAQRPGFRVDEVLLPYGPRFAAVVVVSRDGEGPSTNLLVEPSTGHIQGERHEQENLDSVANFLRQLHVRLLLGAWGRMFVGTAGVALALSCLTGLVLLRRRLASLFRWQKGLVGRARWSQVHRAVAMWSLLFNLLMAVSGAVLGLEGLVARLERHPLFAPAKPPPGAAPAPAPGPPPEPEEPVDPRALAAPVVGPNEAIALASAAVPGARLETIVLPEGTEANEYSVTFTHTRSLLRQRSTFVRVDSRRPRLLCVFDARHAPRLTRVYDTLYPLHFGTWGDALGPLGSLLGRALWALFGLAPGGLALTGAVLWLERRRAASAAKRAPLRRRALLGALLGAAPASLFVWVTFALRAPKDHAVAFTLERSLAQPVALAVAALPVSVALGWGAWALARSRSTPKGALLAGLVGGLAVSLWYAFLARVSL